MSPTCSATQVSLVASHFDQERTPSDLYGTVVTGPLHHKKTNLSELVPSTCTGLAFYVCMTCLWTWCFAGRGKQTNNRIKLY